MAFETDDFSYDTAADKGYSGGGQQEYRFDFIVVSQRSVGLCNGFFKLEIGRIPKSAKDEIHLLAVAVINGEAFKTVHFHIREIFKRFLDKFFSLLQREHIFFLRILAYGNNNFIKQRRCSFHNVIMS